MRGRIIKAIAGFYYVHVEKDGVYECKAKGIFRNIKLTPLVGDDVVIEALDEEKKIGNLVSVLARRNELIRPAVANIDQAMLVFAVADPEPNLNLLDRFLIMMQRQSIDTIICFNKQDIAVSDELRLLEETYAKCGHRIIFASAREKKGIEQLRSLLKNKTTAFAGPSGVGKSSLMNLIQPEACMETGAISEKVRRGKHTTRHSELVYVENNTYLMDTPGFSSLYVTDMDKEELKEYFIEFKSFEDECRFPGCNHLKEPVCGVKRALSEGLISKNRYSNYVAMYEELRTQKNYKK